jgi:hypothetical protein
MWLATKHGFFSIVQKGPDEFHIRARVKKDLENLRAACLPGCVDLPPVQTWPTADYRYRIVATRLDYYDVMQLLVESIDYFNFKSKIAATQDQREKLSAYHDIWATMQHLQK